MTRTRSICSLCGFLAIAAAMALLSNPDGDLAAQIVKKAVAAPKDGKEAKDKSESTDAFSVNVDREASNRVEAIRQYLLKKDPPYDQIVEPMQRMLESPQDSFIEVEKEGTRKKVSVRLEINRMIGLMPEAGRQFYQVTFGPRADQKLKDAILNGDRVGLAEVSEQFLHTKAGGEATVLLGTYYLDRARYIQAALTFQRLSLRNDRDELPAVVRFKAAVAFRRMGDDRNSEAFWKKFVEATKDRREVVMGNKSFTMEQIKKEYDRARDTGKLSEATEWYTFRGDITHSAQGRGGRPFFEPRLNFPMVQRGDTPEDIEVNKPTAEWIDLKIKESLKRFESTRAVPMPMFFPIGASGRVMFRTYDGVYCYATRDDAVQKIRAGELAWAQTAEGSLSQMAKDAKGRGALDGTYLTQTWLNPQMGGAPGVLFENNLIGTLSHDGRNLYMIDDIAVPPHPSFANNMNQFNGMEGQRTSFGPFNDAVHHSKLLAVNLESGKKAWSLGARTPGGPKPGDPKANVKRDAAGFFTDCHFLGAPMPLGGKLYVVVEKEAVLHLACLDPNRTDALGQPAAELVWSQVLGSPNNRILQDSNRRMQGVHLAYSDGIIVVPTNAGAVLGVDLLSHSLVWSHPYREISQTDPSQPALGGGPNARLRGGMGLQPVAVNGGMAINQERWRASAPIVADGKLIFSAFDSSWLTCLSLQDGTELWKVRRAQDDLYVGGVVGSRVVVVGMEKTRILDMNDGGKQVGAEIVTGKPSGVGSLAGGVFFLPLREATNTREPEIWSIDVAKGAVVARTRSRKKHVAGNLMFFEGDVFSQTAEALSIYPQLDIKVAEAERLLKLNPEDPNGLIELAELQLDDGRLDASIEGFRKALSGKPKDEYRVRGREKLFDAMTDLLGADFTRGEKYLAEYRELCDVPGNPPEELRRRRNAHLLIAKGREAQGKLLEAFEGYMTFGTLAGNRELLDVPDQVNTTVRPDVWSRGRIVSMLKKATPEQRKPIEDKIEAEWKVAKQSNDAEKIRGFVRVFGGMLSVGNEARLFLADRLLTTNNEEDVREASGILTVLRDGGEPSLAARATESLARAWIRKGLMEDAMSLYADLGTRFGKLTLPDGRTGEEVYGDLITDKRFLPFVEPQKRGGSAFKNYKGEQIDGPSGQAVVAYAVDVEGENLPFWQRNKLQAEMNMPGTGSFGVRMLDRVTGEEKFRSKPMQQPNYFYPQNNPTIQVRHRFAQVRGHTMLVNVGSTVSAYDLADKKSLWEYDLLGKVSIVNKQAPGVGFDPDGAVRLTYSDGWSHRAGHPGILESSYVCLITREGLTTLDPVRGTVLWEKKLNSARLQLYGDASHIFVFELNQEGYPGSCQVIRAEDGVSLPSRDFSNLMTKGHRYRISGHRLLSIDERAATYYDILKGENLFRKELEKGTLPIRSEDALHMGYVTPKGEVVVYNGITGQQVFAAKMDEKKLPEHLAKVDDAMLMSDPERFYVALNRPVEAAQMAFNNGNQVVQQGMKLTKVNGTVYAFERATGKRLWFSAEQFDNQMILTEQFADLPIIFAGNTATQMVNGNFQGQTIRLIAIDKQSGKTKYRRESPTGTIYAITNDLKTGVIEFLRYDMRVRFTPANAEGKKDEPKKEGLVLPPMPPKVERIVPK